MTIRSALRETFQELALRELEPVDVAVVDSGVDATHPDLQGRVVRAFLVEMDGEEAKLCEQPLGQNLDAYGHGTAVASIIAKVAPNARIHDVRVLNPGNVGAGKALLRGFQHAIEQRIRIVNMSLAATAKFACQLHELCERAYRNNQVVVAAKRNMPLADNGYPAEISSCISVDMAKFASDMQLQFRDDHAIEFVGNGEDVKAAAAGGGYTTLTGTSFATPAVSGLCALLVGGYRDLRPFDVKALLRAFAT
jgi:subtilisin family serine protease